MIKKIISIIVMAIGCGLTILGLIISQGISKALCIVGGIFVICFGLILICTSIDSKK